MPERSKRPEDLNTLAASIVGDATEETLNQNPMAERTLAQVAWDAQVAANSQTAGRQGAGQKTDTRAAVGDCVARSRESPATALESQSMEPMHPGDRTYRNTSIRLPELAVVSDTLRGLTFENCTIHGPAVILPLRGTSIQNCTFDGPAEGLIWVLEAGREMIIGAIGVRECAFFGCRFQGIGLAVRPEDRQQVLEGLGVNQAEILLPANRGVSAGLAILFP